MIDSDGIMDLFVEGKEVGREIGGGEAILGLVRGGSEVLVG
jgi:hypothetical protein